MRREVAKKLTDNVGDEPKKSGFGRKKQKVSDIDHKAQ